MMNFGSIMTTFEMSCIFSIILCNNIVSNNSVCLYLNFSIVRH